MILSLKTQKELKQYMGLQGVGSKGKLAELLDITAPQVSLLLSTGTIPNAKYERLKQVLSDKPVLSKTEDDNN